MPILETLFIKGLFSLLAGAGAKGALVGAVKVISTYGVAKFLVGTAVVCIVIGGIQWTSEGVSSLREGIDALEKGDAASAAKSFAKLAMKLRVSPVELPDAAQAYLDKANLHPDASKAVADAMRCMKDDIAKHMS